MSSQPPKQGDRDVRRPSDRATPREVEARSSRDSATSNRISRTLVGLSSAAILSVYAVGYLHTQTAEEQSAAQGAQPVQPNSAAQPGGPGQAASTTQIPALTAAYRDGTYVGSGSSRHGGIEVTVVVNGGQIASTQITQCLTRYPCSKIATLPGGVVARQTAQVNTVSGATDSSKAFIQAVTNALSYAA